jgi:glyoxylase-like metal-dependent hydrolase (beta-lactamase superfamily II)
MSMWSPCGCLEGDRLTIEGVALDVLYTPGHTDDSYSFRMADRVFTGDTLLIRGTGRTDFRTATRVRNMIRSSTSC